MEQDKKQADKQLIETTVKLANAENDLGFSVDAYLRLLDFKSADVIKNQIEADAKKEVENRRLKKEAEERAEQERLEREKQAELERLAREEQNRIEQEKKAEQGRIKQEKQDEYKQVPLGGAPASVSIDDLPFPDDVDPFVNFVEDPFVDLEPKTIIRKYSITATEDELNQLEDYLLDNNINFFEVIN